MGAEGIGGPAMKCTRVGLKMVQQNRLFVTLSTNSFVCNCNYFLFWSKTTYCWVRAARRAAQDAEVGGKGLVGCENGGRVGAGGLAVGCTGLSGGRVAVWPTH